MFPIFFNGSSEVFCGTGCILQEALEHGVACSNNISTASPNLKSSHFFGRPTKSSYIDECHVRCFRTSGCFLWLLLAK